MIKQIFYLVLENLDQSSDSNIGFVVVNLVANDNIFQLKSGWCSFALSWVDEVTTEHKVLYHLMKTLHLDFQQQWKL